MTAPPGPFRIAMLAACPFPAPQGTQVVIRDLSAALGAAGHPVHLITYGYGYGYGLSTAPAALGVTLHRALSVPAGTRSGPHLGKLLADSLLLRRALQVIRHNACTILHAHNGEGLLLGVLLRRLTGLPLVYHAHNMLGSELPSYFEGPHWQAVAHCFGETFDRCAPRLADRVVVFDAATAALHVARGVDSAQIACIPPGIWSRDLLRDSPAKAHGAPCFVYAGNADAYQNLPLLRQAFAIVRREVPAAELVIITHHAAEPFNAFGAAVTVQAHATLPTLRTALGNASVGVCPRQITTGAPIKILNYLAAGLPVVACRAVGSHLVPPDMGVLAEPHPQAFARAMVQALALRQRSGFSACLPPRLRIEQQVPLYEAVYKTVSSGR